MYAKVHKNGNITVYRDELDTNFCIFDAKGKDAISTFEMLVDNVVNLNELDVWGARMVDGWGVYVLTCHKGNKLCYYIAPDDLATYQRLGRLHLYGINPHDVFDDDELTSIYDN